MSIIIQTLVNTNKKQFYKKLLKTTQISPLYSRKCTVVPKKFISFDEVAAQRRSEARQSIIVQVNSEASYNELYGYCSKYATINGIHHYRNSAGEHFMLIEFSSEDNMRETLQSCGAHQKDMDVMALHSPFLWFRNSTGKKEKFITPPASLVAVDGISGLSEEKVLEDLNKCTSISDQIQVLYDKTTLNDIGTRLRYMVARQLECVFESLYANVAVKPFGSSVNGFGKMGCDLDLVLTNEVTEDMAIEILPKHENTRAILKRIKSKHVVLPLNGRYKIFQEQSNSSRRLVYQDKKCDGGRSPLQRHMQSVGELLELRVPGAERVQKILHARVPIIKFAHEFTDLDCDLCYNNMSGVYMSELLWQYGELDPRVRPLTFAVRRWAKSVGLTNPHPGRWITNFSLTLMVIFFLEQNTTSGSVLPSLNELVKRANKDDTRIAEENLNCTFLRNLNQLPSHCYSQNKANLESLLLGFFEYYSQFDFEGKAISINEGKPIRKPNALPLYIVNPLEQALNVSRNVSFEECERLKLEVRNAAWQLEDYQGQKDDDWGLIAIVEKKTTRGLKKLLRVGNSHRLVSVKDLFDDSDNTGSESSLKNRLQRLIQKSDSEVNKRVKVMKDMISDIKMKKDNKIKFKNNQVENQVRRIQRDKIV